MRAHSIDVHNRLMVRSKSNHQAIAQRVAPSLDGGAFHRCYNNISFSSLFSLIIIVFQVRKASDELSTVVLAEQGDATILVVLQSSVSFVFVLVTQFLTASAVKFRLIKKKST